MIPWWRTIQVPCSLKRSLTLPSSKTLGSPTLNLLGGSESTLGKRKRTVPRSMPMMEAVMVAMPMANQLMKKRRLVSVLAVGFGGAGGAGLGGSAGGVAAGGVAVTFVDSDIGFPIE